MKDRDMDKNDQSQLSTTTAEMVSDVGLFVELGSQGRKEIARLKEGKGDLARQIKTAVYQWHQELGIDPAAAVVPVVLLYRRDR
jgi:hypothetical protein